MTSILAKEVIYKHFLVKQSPLNYPEPIIYERYTPNGIRRELSSFRIIYLYLNQYYILTVDEYRFFQPVNHKPSLSLLLTDTLLSEDIPNSVVFIDQYSNVVGFYDASIPPELILRQENLQ